MPEDSGEADAEGLAGHQIGTSTSTLERQHATLFYFLPYWPLALSTAFKGYQLSINLGSKHGQRSIVQKGKIPDLSKLSSSL